MKPSIKRLFLAFQILGIFFLLTFNTLLAQEDPKIGLVLSGGGAKGMAHIGVLKVIEEAGIEIDYIGGTSMGAIVGALYASGYSAKELDSIFKATDFVELIQDNVPRGAKSFYEKDDSERYALSLPFDNFKVTFPQAFSGGQNIYNQLVKFLFHVKDVQDFSKLPIPFLCIATNVETGEEVLLNKGYLPEAITASGTFPSLFEPSEIDGNLLIDGGVINNYPIEEIRALGADIIIGVDVQHGLSDRDALESATEILLQINNYRTVSDMVEKRDNTDLYIKPDIDNFSVIDFEFTEAIINKGEQRARELLEELKTIAEKQKAPPKPKKNIYVADSLVINRLILKGNDNYTRGFIKGKLRFQLGEKISFKKLEQGISNLSATGNFKAIRYQLISNGLGTDLVLKIKEVPNKMFIKMGAHYNDLYKSSALINLTKKNLFNKDDVGSFDLIVGDHIRYNLQYYVDKGFYWSFGINSKFTDFDKEVDFDVIRSNYEVSADPNISQINLDVLDLTNQFYLQTVLQEEFAFRVGIEHKLLKYSTRTLGVEGEEPQNTVQNGRNYFENRNFYSGFGNITLDTYNDKYFPEKGLIFDSDFHYYVFSSRFNQTNFKDFSIAKAKIGVAFTVFEDIAINIETEGGFKLGTSPETSFDFLLGGFGNDPVHNFIPFFGYDFLSLPGNSFVKAYTRFDYEFSPKNHALFALNFSNVEDDIFRAGEWFTLPDYTGYAIGYALESFIGPIQTYYSWSPERGSGNIFFSVGYWF